MIWILIGDVWMILGIIVVIFGKFKVLEGYGIKGGGARLGGLLFLVTGYLAANSAVPHVAGVILVLIAPVLYLLVAPKIFGNAYRNSEQNVKGPTP